MAIKPERKEMIKEVTRRIIYIAVINIINDEGYAGVTMDKVAELAGVAKGTIYAYFKNKEELLSELFDDALQPLARHVDDILSGGGQPEKKLSETAAEILRFFRDNAKLFRLMIYEREMVQLDSERFRDNRYLGVIEKLIKVFEDGIKAGRFKPLNPRRTAIIFLEEIVVITKLRLLEKDSLPIEDDVDHILEIILNGIKKTKE